MTTDQKIAVHHELEVPLSTSRAFDLFTTRMGEFWPASHSIGASPRAAIIVEPHTGGRWFERGVDGSECSWGRVELWEPSTRLVLIWQINAQWQFDPQLETEVEVSFTESESRHTQLQLVHRHLERFGDQADAMRTVFNSPGGWPGILTAYLTASR